MQFINLSTQNINGKDITVCTKCDLPINEVFTNAKMDRDSDICKLCKIDEDYPECLNTCNLVRMYEDEE